MTDPDAVRTAVLDRLRPSDDERDELREAYEAVKERTRDAVDETGISAEVTLVGSTARDTWLSGDRDIDVFLLLPPQLDRGDFESIGLDVGRAVFPDGTVEYAEHPYVQGNENGYDVDVVPCYNLDDATEVRSAVDRTPFHNEYIRRRADEVPDFGDEVRLVKAFARGAGIYGSDLRTRGFSGYLCELLVLRYGGFDAVVEEATDWSSPVRIELDDETDEEHAEFEGPLVVVDPVDEGRNVASVVNRDSFARFVAASRDYLDAPDESFFFADEAEPLRSDEVAAYIEERATRPIAVVFDAPDVVDDQLYPQLRKTRNSLVEELGRRGFDTVRSDAFADDHAVVFVEANIGEQSRVEKHVGPPVDVREHATAFREKYEDADVVGPYIEDGRYVVERDREYTTVESFVRSDALFGVRLGEHVEDSLRDGYEVLVGEDCAALADEYGFGVELARYFEPTVRG